MDIKDRIKSYEPLFNQWFFDEVLSVYDQESLIRIKCQVYGKVEITYLKVITVYDQDDDLFYLEKRVADIVKSLNLDEGSFASEYIDYEQYLIENNQGKIIGIDLCLLMEENQYEAENIDELKGKEVYEAGLKLFDKHDYNKAFEYFQEGEKKGNSDCICIIGYMYERGLGVVQDYDLAASYYKKAADLNNVVEIGRAHV